MTAPQVSILKSLHFCPIQAEIEFFDSSDGSSEGPRYRVKRGAFQETDPMNAKHLLQSSMLATCAAATLQSSAHTAKDDT